MNMWGFEGRTYGRVIRLFFTTVFFINWSASLEAGYSVILGNKSL